MANIEYSALSIKEICEIARQNGLTLPRFAVVRKESLLSYISQNGTSNLIVALINRAQEKCVGTSKKRVHDDDEGERNVRPRLDWDGFRQVHSRDEYDSSMFLKLPTSEEVRACYRSFYGATSNKALKMLVCSVCARELLLWEEGVQVLRLEDLPNGHRLLPHQPHPAHYLLEGMLFDPAGIQETADGMKVNVCGPCLASLQSNRDVPPNLSLANNLWIGDVPDVLSSLTFPEQLLISHLYPRVYVFKLYPKRNVGGDPSNLQKGMRGTVSTFALDMDGITSMLEGNLMPRPPSLLASIISLTYIGLGKLPKHWLRQFFRVRRHHVLLALRWLKANNSKYYGTVEIDSTRIDSLPNDDVPIELLSVVRQSTDIGVVDQESAGYVPEHEDDEIEGISSGG